MPAPSKSGTSRNVRHKRSFAEIRQIFLDNFKPRQFAQWAEKNQTEYYRLLIKLMPADLNLNIHKVTPFPLEQFKPPPPALAETADRPTVTLEAQRSAIVKIVTEKDTDTPTDTGTPTPKQTQPPPIPPRGGSDISYKSTKNHSSKNSDDIQDVIDELDEGESCEVDSVEFMKREVKRRLGII